MRSANSNHERARLAANTPRNAKRPRVPASLLTVAFAAVAVVVTACGSSGTASGGATSSASSSAAASLPSSDAAVSALVPAAIRKSGTLVIASDATYAPMEFVATDGHTIIGADADLSHALAAVMGLTPKLENIPFDSIIPGLAAKRYDLGVSSFGETAEREKVVDFVSYAKAGQLFYVLADGGPSITNMNQLCGQSMAVEAGTVEQSEAQLQSSQCTKQGKGGVTIHVYGTQTAANLAVSSGRAKIGFADSPVTAYVVAQSNGKFRISGKGLLLYPGVYAIAIPKGSGMTKAVLAAVQATMKDGTYAKIFRKWGLASSIISNPQINGSANLLSP